MDTVHSMHAMSNMDSTTQHMMTQNSSMEHVNHMLVHGNNMTDHGKNTMHNMQGMSHMGGHAVYFSFSLPIRVLFFEWQIVTQGQLAGSCIGVLFMAILYEGLKVWRQQMLRATKRCCASSLAKRNGGKADIDFIRPKRSKLRQIFNGCHIFQSLLQIVQTTMGMFLMLIYMTFNIWLAISISLGSGIGYFVFAWMTPSDPDFGDHCQ